MGYRAEAVWEHLRLDLIKLAQVLKSVATYSLIKSLMNDSRWQTHPSEL